MNEQFDPISHLALLKIPEASLSQLGFCASAKIAGVRTWVNQLRATQVISTSVSLYRALPEVVRLKTEPATRFEMLEALRSIVHQTVVGLTKEFLHQPLILPEQAQKTAIIAQALQKNMLDGYSAIVLELGKSSKVNNFERLIFIQALHRAITALGLMFFRSFQLYTQVPQGLWAHLHLLYRCAKFYELQDSPVEDLVHTNKVTTIEQAYMRVLALGAARLNQVAQNDVSSVYDALAEWSRYIQLKSPADLTSNNLYWVNLTRDRGPLLKERHEGPVDSLVIELNFKVLLNQLNAKDSVGVDYKKGLIPEEFPASLLLHVQNAWGNLSSRDLERRSTGDAASVCVGFSECHYQIAGEQAFDKFLNQDRPRQNNEPTNYSPVGRLAKQATDDEPRAVPLGLVFSVALVNLSAGGYCIEWAADVPAQLEAGDLIAVREAGRRTWNLCVVRWIRRQKDVTQVGVQLISTQAQAFAASAQYEDGNYSSFMRAFYLPAARHGQGPAHLLSPAMPFQEYQPVRLRQDGQTTNGKLENCVLATAKLRQFAITTFDTEN